MAARRVTIVLSLALSGFAGCGSGETSPSGSASAGTSSSHATGGGHGGTGGTGDGGATSGGGEGATPCAGSADCKGLTCCETGNGFATCVPSQDACSGLVLCTAPGDCKLDGEICCPQGFCGGCD